MTQETKATIGIEDFARLIGISKNSAYAAAKDDRLPVPVIRIGRRMLISRSAVDELLAGRRSVGGEALAAATER